MSKFDTTMYTKIYRAAADGLPRTKIAKSLGVSTETLKRWYQKKPGVKYAMTEGYAKHKHVEKPESITEYVYKHLDDSQQELWNEINGEEECGRDQLDNVFKKRNKQSRQMMFIHALVTGDFNRSEAMRTVGISYENYKDWAKDPDFLDLLEEVDEHKRNFFEAQYIRKVKQGDSALILHAAKTQLKDRGYTETHKHKHEHEHSGEIEHRHSMDITAVLERLPVDVRLQVLEVVDAYQAERNNVLEGEVIDKRLIESPVLIPGN